SGDLRSGAAAQVGTCDSRETPAQTTSQDSADRAGHCRHTRHRSATYRRPSATATSREAAVAAGRVPRETRRLAAISSARYGYGSARRVQTTMYPPAVPEVATPCTRRERHPHCPPHPWTSRKIAPDLHRQPEEEQWLHLARSPLARPRDTIVIPLTVGRPGQERVPFNGPPTSPSGIAGPDGCSPRPEADRRACYRLPEHEERAWPDGPPLPRAQSVNTVSSGGPQQRRTAGPGRCSRPGARGPRGW